MRRSKERSDDLTAQSLAAKIARACTSIPDAPPSVTTAIISIPHPNNFRDSFRPSQLRVGIRAAHEEIARGHVQRQQLEEKMRRTFLKGMTAMNMEALELFNKAAQSDASFMSEGSAS